MRDYIIVGDTDRYKDCLVCVCGLSEDVANKILHRMLNNPTDDDKRLIKGHKNLRVITTPKEENWWRGNCD